MACIGPLIPPEDIAGVVATLLDHGQPGEVVEILHKGEQTTTTRNYPLRSALCHQACCCYGT